VIDISKLDKAEVLRKLFNRSKPQGLGFLHYTQTNMSSEKAQELLDEGHTYFDYVQGRVMKVDLSGDEFNEALYDRDNGPGAAKAALGL
jgi:hypothetical protein